MPKPKKVAVMLDLQWSIKRHFGIFAGAQRYAQEHAWTLSVDEFVHHTLAASPTTSSPYDGIIARASKQLAELAAGQNVPLVNVWLSSPARDMLPGVFCDFTAAGRMRADHLLARGFRNFAVLVSRRNLAHHREGREFRRLVGNKDCPCAMVRIPLDPYRNLAAWRKTVGIIEDWMDNWRLPIGVYVGADSMGRYVAQLCLARGWRVPQDVAIIAGMNELLLCEQPRPSLSSVEMGHERIGYEAARLLDRLMQVKANGRNKKRQRTAEPEHVVLPPEALVVRESTDFFAVNDELIAAALEFIAAKSHLRIGPDEVARAVSTEKRTLQRRFRQVLDRPIATEIRRVRKERAKRELAQSDKPLAEIAHDVGFGEAMRMYEVFVRELGITPSEYRKQRQLESGS